MIPADLPHLTIVRVLSGAGPYAEGDLIAVAFAAPTAGRLMRYRTTDPVEPFVDARSVLPETIFARVERAAGPYERGDLLTLSFVDPRIARLQPVTRELPAQLEADGAPSAIVAAPVAVPIATPSGDVRTRCSWHPDRATRFVQVCDKLFTVDRLGWYRHALAMRLLIPDEISSGDPDADVALTSALAQLRRSASEALGRPLLAAFMPAFSVTADWLDSLDDPGAARAVADLRNTIGKLSGESRQLNEPEGDRFTFGTIARSDVAVSSTVEAFLPLLIPNVSTNAAVTEKLTAYRSALIDLFAQTAQSAEAVRLNQMAQPNHTLDDRLWHLVGVVGECFGGLAVA